MLKIRINGIVQGIGFRPFIYRLASQLDLKGTVFNTSSGVEIEAIGPEKDLQKFVEMIKEDHPPAAQIRSMDIRTIRDKKYSSFTIKESIPEKGITLISPDLSLCSDCLQELFDVKDPRYQYAFINCTNCGPRYSVIRDLPYDRPGTSMKNFKMCDYCHRQYTDPMDRRFHAQPVACPECGPQLKLLNNDYSEVKGDPIERTRELLLKGKIIGIKGIGGFHIACDASNKKAINILRKRKDRPSKPFAVMVLWEKLSTIVHYNKADTDHLNSIAAPILILKKKTDSVLPGIAPDNPYLGLFLPYAPVHYLLMNKKLPMMVMTSGNFQDEPIAIEEKGLGPLCDYYLTNDRPILNRSDDSILMPLDELTIMARRSRGYAPLSMDLPAGKVSVPTLGCGAHLKVTFSLCNGQTLFLSPYIGNMDNKKAFDFFNETVKIYQKWFKIEPQLVACDLHPDFYTTRFAESLGLPLVNVQHHHAHIVSVMAEYGINEPVIGIAYDGTGYGLDKNIWGGELIVSEYHQFKRYFHLKYMPLPGGDSAIKHPFRIAKAYLLSSGIDDSIIRGLSKTEGEVITRQIENKFNLFHTSSMGRLFDCVSAMLGLVKEVTFDAQAAMALEFLCEDKNGVNPKDVYPYRFEGDEIDVGLILEGVTQDIKKKVALSIIAWKFHNTVIEFTIDGVKRIHSSTGITKVVLSGGVMQNRIILSGLIRRLKEENFLPYVPVKLPVNDGCISAGQVIIANHFRKDRKV